MTGEEILRYDLGEDFSIETAVVFGELYKNGDVHNSALVDIIHTFHYLADLRKSLSAGHKTVIGYE